MENTKNSPSTSFNSISISIANPDKILAWSHGEVTKPETINYRTQKPERDGLFCEKIFGPTKNWECYCGKYKRIRYKGVICEKCGVEVTHSSVRRQRMAHISLAVPITHTWFVRSTPSRIGLMLDLSVKQIEQIIYFAAYVISKVDEESREEAMHMLDKEFKQHKNRIINEYEELIEKIKRETSNKELRKEKILKIENDRVNEIEELTNDNEEAHKDLKNIEPGKIISEIEYRELSMKFGQVFQAGTGAETIRSLLEKIDLNKFISNNEEQIKKCSEQRQRKIIKRMQLAKSFLKAGIRPEWMVLTNLPVIPPDLRPMVQLDGGRFAASDLNDLYRRIINRNNRLKKLMEIGAPEVICRNEKRMLQEAVDTLLNNTPHAGKTALTSGDHRKLRSLSDMLKGKQGRFRQNLLGKRVDYSGRSVIVVGPNLEMDQCGLPKEMAIKLFKPFIIGRLIRRGLAHNVKNAEKIIQSGIKEVWDELEDVTKKYYVLLNRAPTLHRLGIQAFQPVLIEGKAIQLHPLVCSAFNADFDGDQMAVHLPLSAQAQEEAKTLISSAKNLLKPSAGEPVINASQDMILGCFYITHIGDKKNKKGEGKIYEDEKSVLLDYERKNVHLQAKIKVRMGNGEIHETTPGRIIFHEKVTKPIGMNFQNIEYGKSALKELVAKCFNEKDFESTAKMSDAIKKLGFKFATISGLSISQDDVVIPKEKDEIIEKANEKARHVASQWWKGWLTTDERYNENIKLWSKVKKDISDKLKNGYPENNIFYMIQSGARGNWGQVTQLAGIKGLVANPSGRTIELPIKSNLKDGFSVLEYFSATHGGRKGKSDTALKTAEAGYLTRRLVDAVQDIIIREDDCGQTDIHWVSIEESEKIGESFYARIFGRTLADDLKDQKGKIIAKKGSIINKDLLDEIKQSDVIKAPIRSTLSCQTRGGICQKCYGQDLGSNQVVQPGTPVGIIAAQSIGEPGTQLTMRTFHMGGVAGEGDITQGLERVEELFEARSPKTPALLCDIDGVVKIRKHGNTVFVNILGEKNIEKIYETVFGQKITIKKGDEVREKQIIASACEGAAAIRSSFAGKVINIDNGQIKIKSLDIPSREYELSSKQTLFVKNNDVITAGTALTSGHYNVNEFMRLRNIYEAQRYMLREVQTIYASQGQTINDKHLEIIVREMFSLARIVDPGDSILLPGDVINFFKIKEENAELEKKGERPIRYERLLLGLTRVALKTDSWLSAASFQETIRVLVDAATTKKVDSLSGLKENVIIGRLIPAGEQYRKNLIKK